MIDETIHAATRFINAETQSVRVGFSLLENEATQHDLKSGQIYVYLGTDQGEFNEYLGIPYEVESEMAETAENEIKRQQADLTEIVTHLVTILLVSEINPTYTFDALEFSLPQSRKMPKTIDAILSPGQRQFALGRALKALAYGNARDLNMMVTTERGRFADLRDLIEGYGYIQLIEYQ